MTVFYIKLTSGEELIGQTHKKGRHIVIVQDPMTFEYGESDGRRFIIMTRFNPFVHDKTVELDRKNVLFMKPVMEEVRRYYEFSVNHANEVTDKDFKKGMAVASQTPINFEEASTVDDDLDSPITFH